jgi:hypothetical protein
VQYTFPEGSHLDALLQLRRHIQSLLRVTIEGSEVLASTFSSSLAGALSQLLALSPHARGDWQFRNYFEDLLEYHRTQKAKALTKLNKEREEELTRMLEDWQYERASLGGLWSPQGQRDAFWGNPAAGFLSGTEDDAGGWLDLQQQGGYLGATPAAAAAAVDPRWLPTGALQLSGLTQGDAAGDSSTPELQQTSDSTDSGVDSSSSSSRVARDTVSPIIPQQLVGAGFAEVQQLLAPLMGKTALEITALAWEVLPRLAPLLSDGTMMCVFLPAPKGPHLYFKVSFWLHGGWGNQVGSDLQVLAGLCCVCADGLCSTVCPFCLMVM